MKTCPISQILFMICPESEVAFQRYKKDMEKSLTICTTGLFISLAAVFCFFIFFGAPTMATAITTMSLLLFVFSLLHLISPYMYSKEERRSIVIWNQIREDIIKHPLFDRAVEIEKERTLYSADYSELILLKTLCKALLWEHIRALYEEREVAERRLELCYS